MKTDPGPGGPAPAMRTTAASAPKNTKMASATSLLPRVTRADAYEGAGTMSNLVFDESSANSEASHGYAWWFSGDTFD